MRKAFLAIALLAIPLSLPCVAQNTAPQSVEKELYTCVSNVFSTSVSSVPDKRRIFEEAFSTCSSIESNLLAASERAGSSTEQLAALKGSTRKKIELALLIDHEKSLNLQLRQIGYVNTIALCENADMDFLGEVRTELTGKAQEMDAEIVKKGLILMEAEYYRVTIEIRAREMGREKWCQSERSYLEKQGATTFFRKK